jgi:uncharacterized protein YqeY
MVCVTELKERLRTDLSAAMRERDQVRLRTLRMALTSITNEEVSGAAARELSDDEVLKVLTREAKKRREAAEAFESAGRADQAAAERAEGDVLAEYLPAQLGDDELAAIVEAAVAETGVTEMRAMGQVMKAVTPRIAGRADGARVAAEVRRRLAAGSALSISAATYPGFCTHISGRTGRDHVPNPVQVGEVDLRRGRRPY